MTKNVFQDQLSLNAGQKFCRMLQGEHSAILLTLIKLPFVIKILVLSFFLVAVLLYIMELGLAFISHLMDDLFVQITLNTLEIL